MKPLNKIIIAPDSFKGVLSASQAADIIAEEVKTAFPVCEIVKMPIADGGEGSVSTILNAMGGEMHEAQVLSPDDRLIRVGFGITKSKTAILEMAQSSGLTKQNGLHPMTSSTYGFGQLILAALDCGMRDFMLCIGGSATTDGGCGMAAALGVTFLDSRENSFVPCGATLAEIARIDTGSIDSRVRESKFIVMSDVDNPLFGPNGAAFVYGPQKGAEPEQILALDSGLCHFGGILSACFGKDYANVSGAGAAGGLGAGCMAFLGAKLMSGSEAILGLCGFKEHLADASLIITGEGKLDAQSLSGKVLSGILREAGDVPVWSVCGICECDEAVLREHGVIVFEASEGVGAFKSMAEPEKYLSIAAQRAAARLKGMVF